MSGRGDEWIQRIPHVTFLVWMNVNKISRQLIIVIFIRFHPHSITDPTQKNWYDLNPQRCQSTLNSKVHQGVLVNKPKYFFRFWSNLWSSVVFGGILKSRKSLEQVSKSLCSLWFSKNSDSAGVWIFRTRLSLSGSETRVSSAKFRKLWVL